MGLAPGALDPSITWAEIGMRGRSMMEILQVASKEVRVPDGEITRGAATANQSTLARKAQAVQTIGLLYKIQTVSQTTAA